MSDVDALEPESPAWWLHRLLGRLLQDQPRMILMDRYYRGQHPLPFVPRELRVEYGQMLARSRSNFMRMPIEAPAQRLQLQGFRPAGSEQDDLEAWGRWGASGMIPGFGLSINDSLVFGRTYLSVWVFDGDEQATIQVEDPRGTIVAYDRKNRRKRAAGLRVWVDEWTGKVRADVWLPKDGCYQFESAKPSIIRAADWPTPWEPAGPISAADVGWTEMVHREESMAIGPWRKQWNEIGFISNPWEVPILEGVNRPSVSKWPDGESEIEDVVAVQDRINEMLFNRSLAAFTTAYRQKWATGLDIPVDESGNPVQPYQAAIDRLWVSESPDTKFGDFAATDLKPYIESIEQDVQHIAVQTQTPRHYFHVQGQEPSGDSMKSAESGLVAKVRDKHPTLGALAVGAQRLASIMDGVSSPQPLEAVWSDPENRTMAETTDAVLKQFGAGVITLRVAQEKLGFSPSEIRRMASELEQDRLIAAAMTSEPEPVAPVEV